MPKADGTYRTMNASAILNTFLRGNPFLLLHSATGSSGLCRKNGFHVVYHLAAHIDRRLLRRKLQNFKAYGHCAGGTDIRSAIVFKSFCDGDGMESSSRLRWLRDATHDCRPMVTFFRLPYRLSTCHAKSAFNLANGPFPW